MQQNTSVVKKTQHNPPVFFDKRFYPCEVFFKHFPTMDIFNSLEVIKPEALDNFSTTSCKSFIFPILFCLPCTEAPTTLFSLTFPD